MTVHTPKATITPRTVFARIAAYGFSVVLAILSLLTSGIGFASPAYADASCDKTFYASNDVLFFDNCEQACATNNPTDGYLDSTDNSEAIFKYLTSTGFKALGGQPMSAIQAAAFVGNMYVESKYDPAAIQSGASYNEAKAMNGSVGGYAFGLVQWDGGRRVALLKYVESKKPASTTVEKAWTDITYQLDYLKKELDGSESGILKDSQFKTTSDIATATERVTTVFERAGSPNMTLRTKAAQDTYNKYVDTACTTSGSDTQGAGDIVATAKELSWEMRSTQKNADHTALQNKPQYTKALDATGINKKGDSCSMAGNSCDAFVATVMRYSGADPTYPCCGANSLNEYMKKHSDRYQMVKEGVTSTKELQPGDILWRDGHIKIYIGDGKEAAASHCERTGEQSQLFLDGKYYAYRLIK